ncbi:MAG: hypothetical protein DYG89_10030 [Caldilinea sp. CFX5]|nr:hypothetical protein [Caldilinea sp. CFX5]
MKANWIPTNQYYQQILMSSDSATRHQLYLNLIVEPWQPMMTMVTGDSNGDALAGARAWKWLLPDQLVQIGALLAQMEAAHAWQVGADALEKAVAAFAPWHDQIGFPEITGWLLLADPAQANPVEPGYTGAIDWLNPRFVCQFWQPNEANLSRIGAVIAHEMHHLIRLRAFPWHMHNTTVADYIVMEGTAESFATALFGADKVGDYAIGLTADEFAQARRLIGQGLQVTGFNVLRSYIFGDTLAEQSGFAPLGGMPRYGGYAIGYHIVQEFLRRSGLSITETTFLPADEIVAGSGVFAE